MVAQIIELSCRKITAIIQEFESAGRSDERRPPAHPFGPALTIVAEEQLVAALAAKHDLHVLGGLARQIPEGDPRICFRRFIESRLNGREDVGRRFRLDRQNHMLAAEMLRDCVRSGSLVDLRAGKPAVKAVTGLSAARAIAAAT